MPNLIDTLLGKKEALEPIPAGLYAYHTPPESEAQYRLHLRVEPDGEGLLIVNASSVLHLNQTATEIAWHLIQGHEHNAIAEAIAKRYQVSPEEVLRDSQAFQDKLLAFVSKTDQEPVSSFGFEPHYNVDNLSAPYRLDCGLTYRTSEEQAAEGELDTQQWKMILNKAYKAGIPHFVFFGGDPTLRPDLLDLLGYTEELGCVSGLVSNGAKLNDESYVNGLITAGLDHLMVPVDPLQERMTNAIRQLLPKDLYTCVHYDIDETQDYGALIQEMRDLGVHAFSFHPSTEEMVPRTQEYIEYLDQSTVNLVEDLPLPYEHTSRRLAKAVQENYQGEEAFVLLQVDPTGKLLTRDGQVLGDMLTEDFDAIWARRITLV